MKSWAKSVSSHCTRFRDMVGLMFHHILQMSHVLWIWQLSNLLYCIFLQRISESDMSLLYSQSTYPKRLRLGPELFAFLVKLSLEGAFSVLLSSLETLMIYLTSLWNTD